MLGRRGNRRRRVSDLIRVRDRDGDRDRDRVGGRVRVRVRVRATGRVKVRVRITVRAGVRKGNRPPAACAREAPGLAPEWTQSSEQATWRQLA